MNEINNNSTEKIDENSEKITSNTEKIDENSEKITSNTEKIDENSEKITSETEKIPEQIRYRGQRGPDKNKRRSNPNSLKNLMQNKNKIFEEKKPIWKKPEFWVAISGITALGILALKLYEIMDESRQEDSEEEIKELEE